MNSKTYFIKVFGCQMNVAEAEAIEARYVREGWQRVDKPELADEIIIHTCSVRESAENRVYGLINNLKNNQQITSNNHQRIIVTGCILRLSHAELTRLMPTVDEFTTVNQLIDDIRIRIHQKGKHTWVPISNGCNNFCSYCVVPYSRGREISRNFDDIVDEVEQIEKVGFSEITLLGQNVNSYGKDFDTETKNTIYCSSENRRCLVPVAVENNEQKYYYPSENIFCLLVQRLHQVHGIKKISFLTSNPWDFTDDITRLLSLPKIDRYLHLPVQSGSNRILKLMNRKYTAENYLSLVAKIKRAQPKITLGTDIIVGFPGETEKDFDQTVDLCKRVGFIKGYINQYSPRSGTLAFRLKDTVSHPEKARRWKILDNLVNQKKATPLPLRCDTGGFQQGVCLKRPKVIIICGPTATGKTTLAVDLAKKHNGEIVSADSRQVYRGMDIITGKDIISGGFQKATPLQSRCDIGTISKGSTLKDITIGYYLISGIKLWLTDLVNPDYRFNVSEYVELANKAISDILTRGKLPIIVGGTGFYLRGLFGNIETLGVPPNIDLRKKLEKLSVADLQNKLDKLSPELVEGFNQSDINNPRRLIRAIEIALQDPKIQRFKDNNPINNRDILTIGLTTNNLELYRRIDKRVDERIKAGAEKEIQNLLKTGYNWDNSALGSTIGYRQWRDYFEEKASREEVTPKWRFAEHAYARRQMTWFKKDKDIHWFDISNKDHQNSVAQTVRGWLSNADSA